MHVEPSSSLKGKIRAVNSESPCWFGHWFTGREGAHARKQVVGNKIMTAQWHRLFPLLMSRIQTQLPMFWQGLLTKPFISRDDRFMNRSGGVNGCLSYVAWLVQDNRTRAESRRLYNNVYNICPSAIKVWGFYYDFQVKSPQCKGFLEELEHMDLFPFFNKY